MGILNQSSLVSGITDPISSFVKNPLGIRGRKVQLGSTKDFPEGFFIVEYVDGKPTTTEEQAFRLTGNYMPMQPFPWDSEQRLVKEYYPGNPEPSVHVLGFKNGDLNIKGRFKDKKFDGQQIPYGISYQYSRALDGICKRGNLLKFGMHGVAGNWIRYGYLEKTSFKMDKLSWIDYELTFFVMGETQPKNNYFAEPEKALPDQINQELLRQAAIFNANTPAPFTMPFSIAGLINDITNDVASTMASVTGFVTSILTTITDVENSAVRALSLVKVARTQLVVFKRQLGGIAYTYASLSKQSVGAGQFTDVVKNISYIENTKARMNDLSFTLAKMQAQFELISRTLPLKRYKVQDKDTLQNIAIKFYGSADHWDKIYSHNKLQTTSLTAGSVLEIPKL